MILAVNQTVIFVAGMKIKKLIPKDEESQRLSEWIDKGDNALHNTCSINEFS